MSLQPQHDRIARRLQALREERRITQEALASALGFNDRQTLAAIEAGQRRVSPEELVRAANLLGVEVDAFLDPYRLVGEGTFSFRAREVDPGVLSAFEERAGRWIATYRELGIQTGSEPRRIGLKLELAPQSSFEDVLASAEQLWTRWSLGDVPADRLEYAIERELGVLVLYVDPPAGISGAASRLPGQDTIFVNRQEPVSRRSVDLAHELFHLLTWDAMPPKRVEPWEVRPTKGNRVELMAESFAAALLMPRPVLSARWAGRADEDFAGWMSRTAAELRVGVPALQLRLANLGYLAKATLKALRAAPRPVPQGPGEPMPPLFSRPFVARVADAVEAGRLSLRRAATLLGLSATELAGLCGAHGCPLPYNLPG